MSYKKRIDQILAQLNELIPHDVVDLLLVSHGLVRSARWRGYEKFGLQDSIETVTYELAGTTNLQLVRETGRPLAIPFVEQYEPWVSRPGLDWIKSQASAPIRLGSRVIGFLNINSTTPGLYSQQDADRLQFFASYIATTLENARLESQTRQMIQKHHETEQTLQRTVKLIERAKQEWEISVDSLPQLICLLDRQGRVLRANRTVARWGLSQVTRVKGKDFHTLIHPDCQKPGCYLKSCWSRAHQQLGNGQTVECEADDEILQRTLHVQIRPAAAPYQSGLETENSAHYAMAVISDITARKRTDRELRRSQARNQALLEAIPDLMLQIGRDGQLLDLISSGKTSLPLPLRENWSGQLTDLFPPGGAEAILRKMKQALSRGEIQQFEYQQVLDDRWRYYEIRLAASGDDEVLALMRDVTARKEIELELKRYQDELEEVIAEHSGLLLQTKEQLQVQTDRREEVEERLFGCRQELAWLGRLVTAVAAAAGPKGVISAACHSLADTLDLPRVQAFRFRPDGSVEPLTDSLPGAAEQAACRLLPARIGPLVINNARLPDDPELADLCRELLGEGISSLLLLPLTRAEKVTGALSLVSAEAHHFSEFELRLARTAAVQLSEILAQKKPT